MMATYEPANGFSPDTESAGTLTLDFSDSRAVGNKCLSRPVYGILLGWSEQTNTPLSSLLSSR